MNKTIFIRINRIVAWTFALGLFVYIGFANTLPFGAKAVYTNTDNSVSAFGPVNRTELADIDGVQVTKQKDDLIYFSTKFPFKFDNAKIKIIFKNPNSLQMLEAGYRDKTEWHYDMQVIDAPIFNVPEWQFTDGKPNLYERNSQFNSVDDFFANPPTRSTIGTLDYKSKTEECDPILDYVPSSVNTIIDVPLRGAHTMYVYLEDEPFMLEIKKQDLNWYDDPDVMEIKIYKGEDLVYTAVIDDDGITDDSKYLGPVQEVVIQNPGPGLPEDGVYKVVFDAPSDTIIKSITTNLHKIVFVGAVFPVFNVAVYPSLVQESIPTTLYTNGGKITALIYHGAALQDIIVNNQIFPLTETHVSNIFTINNDITISEIVIPKSDVIIGGMGYFSFSKDQLFTPNKFNLLPITPSTDLNLVDYVLTPHDAPIIDSSGYATVEREFDLTSAVPAKGRLSWMIRAKGLKENEREVIIKNINVTYTKAGWWKK